MSFLDGNIFESIILAIVVAGILGPMWWLTYISILRNIKKGKSGRVIKENFTREEAEIIFSVMEYIDRISLYKWKERVVSGKIA